MWLPYEFPGFVRQTAVFPIYGMHLQRLLVRWRKLALNLHYLSRGGNLPLCHFRPLTSSVVNCPATSRGIFFALPDFASRFFRRRPHCLTFRRVHGLPARMSDDPFIQRLRSLIGRDCRYLGRDCRIVEVLSETQASPGQLVLEAIDGLPPIQTDQFGQAVFRANEHIEIPLQGPEGDFSEELMLLLETLDAANARRQRSH